jgi:phage shock protein C
MTARRTKFYLDKQHGKWMGVCSGIADYTGIDALWLRVGAIVLTIAGSGMLIIAYLAIGFLATKKPIGLYENDDEARFWQRVRTNPARSARDVRAKMRDIDRRLADMELYYTSRNTQLASEIDALR